jgi:hypothetical protein
MAWSWRAADQVRETLQKREREWEEPEPATAERDGVARPKERLRWPARSESALRARRS